MNPNDELAALKHRADLMGIPYRSNIGIESLRAKIQAKLDDKDPNTVGEEGTPIQNQNPPDAAKAEAPPQPKARPKTKAEIEQEIRDNMQHSQMALVRVRITCLNPAKREIKGEIVTVANKYLGTVRKFIPFGEATDNGFHIPRCLLNELKDRKFNSVTTKRGANGQMLPIQRLVPEFAIEELPPLTKDELHRLAAAQLAAEGGN